MKLRPRPTGAAMPSIGKLVESVGPASAMQYVAVLPAVLVVIFGIVYLRDRALGGYKVEKLQKAEE